MAKGIMIALSDPVSKDREEDFNNWYNHTHGNEVTSLKGFRNITRYRAVAQVVPPNGEPAYRYLAVYELDDVDTAVASLTAGAGDLNMSDAVNLGNATGIAFEQIFTTKE